MLVCSPVVHQLDFDSGRNDLRTGGCILVAATALKDARWLQEMDLWLENG